LRSDLDLQQAINDQQHLARQFALHHESILSCEHVRRQLEDAGKQGVIFSWYPRLGHCAHALPTTAADTVSGFSGFTTTGPAAGRAWLAACVSC
jgi:hypothetical protein